MLLHSAHTDKPAWPGPAQSSLSSPLADGRVVWAGKRDGTKPLEIPKISLTVTQQLTWATAPREGKEERGKMSPRSVYPTIIWNNLTELMTANPLALLLLVLFCLVFKCQSVYVPLSLEARIWDKMYNCVTILVSFNCCHFAPGQYQGHIFIN